MGDRGILFLIYTYYSILAVYNFIIVYIYRISKKLVAQFCFLLGILKQYSVKETHVEIQQQLIISVKGSNWNIRPPAFFIFRKYFRKCEKLNLYLVNCDNTLRH